MPIILTTVLATDTFEQWRVKTNQIASDVLVAFNRTIALTDLPPIAAKTILGNSLATVTPLVNATPVAITVSATNGIIITDASALQLVAPSADGGITMSSATGALAIKLVSNSGLVVGTTGLSLALATNSGLVLSSGVLALSLANNSGLVLSSGVLALSLATNSGLVLTDNKLALAAAATDSGLVLDNENKIKIRLKTATVVTGVPTKVISTALIGVQVSPTAGGLGYRIGHILTAVGGTLANNSTAATFRVSDVIIKSAIVTLPGTTAYAIYDVIRLIGGTTVNDADAQFRVTAIKNIVSAAINVFAHGGGGAGSNYAVGDVLTIAPGVLGTLASGGAHATFRVATLSSPSYVAGILRGPVNSVTLISAGNYTVVPGDVSNGNALATTVRKSDGTAYPVGFTGGIPSGCLLTLFGTVTKVDSLLSAGNYTAFPSNPVSAHSLNRSAQGLFNGTYMEGFSKTSEVCKLTVIYSVKSVTLISAGSYTTFPLDPVATTTYPIDFGVISWWDRLISGIEAYGTPNASAGGTSLIFAAGVLPAGLIIPTGSQFLLYSTGALAHTHIGNSVTVNSSATTLTIVSSVVNAVKLLLVNAIGCQLTLSYTGSGEAVNTIGTSSLRINNINPLVNIVAGTPIRGIGLQDDTVTDGAYAAGVGITAINLSKPIVYPGITASDYTISTASGNSPASGLEIISSGGLAIKCGATGTTGLIVDQYGLRVKLVTVVVPEIDYNNDEKLSGLIRKSDGLQSTHGLSIARPLSSGLDITASGLKVKLAPNSGLDITASGLKIKLAPNTEFWRGAGISDAGLMIRYRPNIVSSSTIAKFWATAITKLEYLDIPEVHNGTSPDYINGYLMPGNGGEAIARRDFMNPFRTTITALNNSPILITVSINGILGIYPAIHPEYYGTEKPFLLKTFGKQPIAFKLYKTWNTSTVVTQLHPGYDWITHHENSISELNHAQASFHFLDTTGIPTAPLVAVTVAGGLNGTSIEEVPTSSNTYSTITYHLRFIGAEITPDMGFLVNASVINVSQGFLVSPLGNETISSYDFDNISSMTVQEMPV